MAAREVLGEAARTGSVHLLQDNQRISVPVDDAAVSAAVGNIEWAVGRILDEDFPMRPHPEKWRSCGFRSLCTKTVDPFKTRRRTRAMSACRETRAHRKTEAPTPPPTPGAWAAKRSANC